MKQCVHKMAAKLKSKGFIGVELDHNKETHALTVTRVIEKTPAERAGIQKGDELYAVNGLTYSKENMDTVSKLMKPDHQVTVTIKRNGVSKDLKVTLASMPEDTIAKYIGHHVMHHLEQEKHASR